MSEPTATELTATELTATEPPAASEPAASEAAEPAAPPVLFVAPSSRDRAGSRAVAGAARALPPARRRRRSRSPPRQDGRSATDGGDGGDGEDAGAEPEDVREAAEAEASGAARRRRRRGRRGRGGAKGGESDAAESGEDDESDQSSPDRQRDGARAAAERPEHDGAAEADEERSDGGESDGGESDGGESDGGESDGGESGDGESGDGESSSSARRRRRRRRSGSSGGNGSGETTEDDPPNTVTHVREPKAKAEADDGVKGVKGSTRLEARRQRRRDGRETNRRRPPILTEAEFLARREAVERVMAVRQNGDRTQIAVLEDDVLVEHYVTRASATSYVGNVYLGRVQNVLPSMEAAFIDIGKGRNGVLYAGEVNWDAAGLEGKSRAIEQALKSGDMVLVQVTKDPIGHKGARLTSQISLPGRFLVYVPGGGMTGISRRLPDTERHRLKSDPEEDRPGGRGRDRTDRRRGRQRAGPDPGRRAAAGRVGEHLGQGGEELGGATARARRAGPGHPRGP